MPVRSVAVSSGESEAERKKKASAIVSRAALVRQRGTVERISAWGVLLLSFLGTVVAFHGGWGPVLALRLTIVGVGGGLLAQGVLTWLQWAYGDRKTSLWYLGSLAVDAALTVLGYGPLLAPVLTPALTGRVPQPDLAGWMIVGIVAILIAWYPDNRLVD